MTFNQRKIFSKLENKKIKIYCLGGGRRISIKKPYFLKRDKKRKIVRLFYGREEICFFNEGVSPGIIRERILKHQIDQNKKKKGGFMEAIEERNDSLRRKPPENKITFFDRKPKRGGRLY